MICMSTEGDEQQWCEGCSVMHHVLATPFYLFHAFSEEA